MSTRYFWTIVWSEPDEPVCGSFSTETEFPVFALSGLSKLAGLPQMKLGWIAAAGPRDFLDQATPRLEIIADSYLSAGTPVQLAAGDLLALGEDVRRQISHRTSRNLRLLRAALTGTSMTVLKTEGGWCAVVELPRVYSELEWVTALIRDAGVYVQPGYFYDFPGEAFVVLSLLVPEPAFEHGVRRLAQFVGNALARNQD